MVLTARRAGAYLAGAGTAGIVAAGAIGVGRFLWGLWTSGRWELALAGASMIVVMVGLALRMTR